MQNNTTAKPDYGNWVSKRLIFVPGMISLVFVVLAVLIPWLLIPGIIFITITGYFLYARYQFSSHGGNVQTQIRELVLNCLDWNGEGQLLDIGCGNGALVTMLAHKYPISQVMGVDYWGENWEYSKNICDRNARIEGVDARVSFRKASASDLPFEDETFDAVVSNLVFHEVGDAKDKRALIREALRVVKKGGKFTFQDLFLLERLYGNIDDLVSLIQGWGISRVEYIETRNAPFIPLALKLPFMVGTIGIITGEK